MAALTFLALRSPDIERLRTFYSALGISFVQEQHGEGPVHYAGTLDGSVVLELYPGKASKAVLGFSVEERSSILAELTQAGVSLEQLEDHACVVRDPDGRRIELSFSKL